MRVFNRSTLATFWVDPRYKDSEEPLKVWFAEAEKAKWKSPQDIKGEYAKASFVGNNRVIFNIKRNDYRLIVSVAYEFEAVYIKFIGTHKQYDKVNAETVEVT